VTSLAAASVTYDPEALVARLAALDHADERTCVLATVARAMDRRALRTVAERLKDEADRARYHDAALARRWCADVVTLGMRAEAPSIVALGRMVEALLLYDQGRHLDSLALFDEAGNLARSDGDEVGWARVQIGRIGPCRALLRFDEALRRADEARAILDMAGERLRAASIDNNLAMLLDQMGRPADALAYSERALATYRDTGARHVALMLDTLSNHALLLWRLGHVRAALQAHQEARDGYGALGAALYAAREDLNIGAVYLALGHYATAMGLLASARRDLRAGGLAYPAAQAGLYLLECDVRLGRFREALATAIHLRAEFARCEAPVEQAWTLLWEALARARVEGPHAALDALHGATTLLATGQSGRMLAPYQALLDMTRAQMLLETGQALEADRTLRHAIPLLQQAGLVVEAATARVLWGGVLMLTGRLTEARAVASSVFGLAEREGLDWLAARALHLHGRVLLGDGAADGARTVFARAVQHLDRVHGRVAWDDRASFAGTTTDLYRDAITLALRQGRTAVALRYVERSKARALADHLRAGVEVQPRVRDERSRDLVAELQALRDRHAWLEAVTATRPADDGGGTRPIVPVAPVAPVPAARWGLGSGETTTTTQAEAMAIEQRIADVWRELQRHNPAYHGQAAALDFAVADEDDGEQGDEDTGAARWVERTQVTLRQVGTDALVEYTALGDDLVAFVLRAGMVHARRLDGAAAALRRLVPLLRLNVERSAATAAHADSLKRQSLRANAEGLLRRLHEVLLAPVASWLDDVTRITVVPHGVAHHVPFHALHDGRAYVVEHAEVTYAPCGSLITHFARRHLAVTEARLGHANPALVLSCSAGGALPHTAAEGERVAAILGGRLLRDGDASLASLRALCGDCTVLHLAAHARFRPDEPLFSALQLDDGQLSTLDVFNLDLRCSLATLSACETALGTVGAGDEVMGLSRAFLYAGAPSLLLSLWKVADSSTAALMERFYRSLVAGADKGTALRQAQLALLHGEPGTHADWSAPFFWAPFQLVGHPGPL